MNKNIASISREADQYANDQYATMTPLSNWNDYEAIWWNDYNTKFAELIVSACVENIEQFECHITPVSEIVPTLVSEIKEYFDSKSHEHTN